MKMRLDAVGTGGDGSGCWGEWSTMPEDDMMGNSMEGLSKTREEEDENRRPIVRRKEEEDEKK